MALLVQKFQAHLQISDTETGIPKNYLTRFLTAITDALNGTSGTVAAGVNQVRLGIGSNVSSGVGSPNGVVSGSPGDTYYNTAGGAGATLWVKESGSGTDTGWVAK